MSATQPAPATFLSTSATFRIDVVSRNHISDKHLEHEAALLGLTGLGELRRSRYYLVRGTLDAAAAQRLGETLLSDPCLLYTSDAADE